MKLAYIISTGQLRQGARSYAHDEPMVHFSGGDNGAIRRNDAMAQFV
jgi:hypothetical protein